MKKNITFCKDNVIFQMITGIIGLISGLLTLVTGLNIFAVVSVGYMCISAAVIIIGVIFFKKLYRWGITGYIGAAAGTVLNFIIRGADAGFGAFSSGKTGWSTQAHKLFSGAGNILTRICGNLILILPCALALTGLILLVKKCGTRKFLCGFLSVILAGTTVFYVLTMNLRANPQVKRLWKGQDEFLGSVDRHKKDSPNVLFILMDDLGWGDISLNGAIYDTPNIDRIGQEGISFDNFYSSYSVCSPARFALMTGRYPFRGYADNVIYPTVDTLSPFASTRIFNSVELGANCDGMLGDEITIAEVFQNAGYDTGCFGKWHLGDYGEYLPTNQGFDYFYGSHYVNDMTPFYHCIEQNGEYEIVHGTDELRDQSRATEWINGEMLGWLDNQMKNSDEPFFVYYSCPWPHAPVYAGDDFDGKTGMGTYVDCVTEVDYYLGKLFDELEKNGELDNTIIVFTSDNGPALEGSTGELRGGKYLAYEGGQKVPCMIKWGNGNVWKPGEKRSQSATLVDMYPTLLELCGITANGKTALPEDRTVDGISMLPLLQNDSVIHTKDYPILYMKREKLKAIQYTVPTAEILAQKEYAGYGYKVLKDNEYIDFKYFQRIQNDNSAFFDKFRKNWLHILSDDTGENYNRTPVYPTVSDEMSQKMDEIMKDFRSNRRGIKTETQN